MVIFLQDIRPYVHTAKLLRGTLDTLNCHVLAYATYSPNSCASDYHLLTSRWEKYFYFAFYANVHKWLDDEVSLPQEHTNCQARGKGV